MWTFELVEIQIVEVLGYIGTDGKIIDKRWLLLLIGQSPI